MNSLAWAEISYSALKHNLNIAKQAAPDSKVMAVIKSDAYGHGAIEAAHALNSADAYAVARTEEAIKLRNSNIMKDIIVLSGIHSEQDLLTCLDQQLQPVIHSEACIELIANIKPPIPLKIWLKVDTGMHRIGLHPDNLGSSFHTIRNIEQLECLGLISHLSDAEIVTTPSNQQQNHLFTRLANHLNIDNRSLCNSAGILFHKTMHYEWVRPGIMLYGANPSEQRNDFTDQLIPAMNFKSRVISIKPVRPGDKVGYNGIWEASESSNIATIAVGYGDGYPRHARNGTPVFIRNKNYPLVGRVSMDMITVDIGKDDIQAGDEVMLWGDKLPAEVIAANAQTISYQLFCGVTTRVNRVYSK